MKREAEGTVSLLSASERRVGDQWMQPIAEILEEWDSTDGAIAGRKGGGTWDLLLDEKRDDPYYPDVVESLRENGFVRPLTCWGRSTMIFGDGHHRLAAAIDLGLTHVPVERTSGFCVSGDSGVWEAGQEIPTSNAA